MTDYCDCGKPASGRCVRDGAFVCDTHERHYPKTLAHLLEQEGQEVTVSLERPSGPPLTFSGWLNAGGVVLCPNCLKFSVNAILPRVVECVGRLARGSVEQAAVRLIRTNVWEDNRNGFTLFGPRIITALAGSRPDWLFDGSIHTLAALYATVARRRSLTPPRLEVRFRHSKRTNPLIGTPKVKDTYEPVCALNAWAFPYRDEHDKVWLVGARGAVVGESSMWQPDASGFVTITQGSSSRQEAERIKQQVEATPQNSRPLRGNAWSQPPLVEGVMKLLR